MTVQLDVLRTWLQAHTRTERGGALVEYTLLLTLVAVVAIAAMGFLGGMAEQNLSTSASRMS